MATFDRKYQRASRDKIESCVKYCQNLLQLRDWHIFVYYYSRDKNKRFCGETVIENIYREVADIWLDLDYCKAQDISPLSTVCHEMLHVLIGGKGQTASDGDIDENIVYILEPILYEKYCRDTKTKLMPIKE